MFILSDALLLFPSQYCNNAYGVQDDALVDTKQAYYKFWYFCLYFTVCLLNKRQAQAFILQKHLPKNDVADEDAKEKHDAESMAKYFEQKYGGKRKRKDRMRDLADVGYGYDETDPFVDNSECVCVPLLTF